MKKSTYALFALIIFVLLSAALTPLIFFKKGVHKGDGVYRYVPSGVEARYDLKPDFRSVSLNTGTYGMTYMQTNVVGEDIDTPYVTMDKTLMDLAHFSVSEGELKISVDTPKGKEGHTCNEYSDSLSIFTLHVPRKMLTEVDLENVTVRGLQSDTLLMTGVGSYQLVDCDCRYISNTGPEVIAATPVNPGDTVVISNPQP